MAKGNKFHAIKEVYKGIKFDSQTECDYFKYLESLGYVHNETFYTQVKYIIQDGFEFGGKKIRPIIYIADFVLIRNDGSKEVIDIKGFIMTAVFNMKVKMMLKVYGIEVITIGRCPDYFLDENCGNKWLLMEVKSKLRKCTKKYLPYNDNKPWILNSELLKLKKKLDNDKK